MMETGKFEIQEVPIGTPFFRSQVEGFLEANGLRLEDVDTYFSLQDTEGRMVAGGGIKRDVLKCIAVSEAVRSEGLVIPLISRLISVGAENGYTDLKVFTKPENRMVFESLGFHVIAQAPQAVLLENGKGLDEYCTYLCALRKPGRCGAVVMNANPFTWGHRYLAQKAIQDVEALYILVVKEDCSRFSYPERLEMVRRGAPEGAVVCEGSDYAVSATTFPTYFLKDLSDASETQMRLDLDLFGRRIAPALGVSIRFVGSEPSDPLTARYNALMQEVLPGYGIQVVEIPRLCDTDGHPVSGSRVRMALDTGCFRGAARLTPPAAYPCLLADLVARALQMELEASDKPGLVGPDGSGAHADMDFALMQGSIDVIRRSYVQHFSDRPEDMVAFGMAVEADVLQYTGGINTHRGAIFSQILLSCAILTACPEMEPSVLQAAIRRQVSQVPPGARSHGAAAVKDYGVKGALQMARDGYKDLFDDWLPFYRSVKEEPYGLQKTLLDIMSTLDDTCVIHRVGYGRAQEVKAEAAALLKDFDIDTLKEMNLRYSTQRVSPGGSADMLALTVLADSLLS